MSVSTSGFALRVNGTCASNQEDCGATVDPYRVCCPESSFCPRSYNVDCCPTTANCTTTLLRSPQCANQSWDLYDNGGYFCCLPDHTGYAATNTGSNGCASPGYSFQPGEVLLKLISAGQEPTSSVSSSSTISTQTSSSSTSAAGTASSSASATSTPSPENNAGLSGGAIAGIIIGVVGGIIIALIGAWLIWRRRRRQPPAPQEPQVVGELPVGMNNQYSGLPVKSGDLGGYYGRSELEPSPRPAELDEQHGTGELDPGNGYMYKPYAAQAQELDGMEIPRRM